MNRNFGLPPKEGDAAFRNARNEKPVSTLLATAAFGVIGAAVAAISFNEARESFSALFHGRSLVAAVLAAGFGCWMYVWIARPRFAAHFKPERDPFSDLVKFYAKAAISLLLLLVIGRFAAPAASNLVSVMVLCAAGGAAAAAAFQTVLAFVPAYETESEA